MEQMDFSIEVSESEIEKFADYLYQKENAKARMKQTKSSTSQTAQVPSFHPLVDVEQLHLL